MWKKECYRLCLSIHRTQQHIDRLLQLRLTTKKVAHQHFKVLSEILMEVQQIFLHNTCPKLAPELPEPMEEDIFKDFPVIYSNGASFETFDIAPPSSIQEQVRVIKNRYAEFTKVTGMATLSDLHMLIGDVWDIDRDMLEFFDQYFCFFTWTESARTPPFDAKRITSENKLLKREGATIYLAGMEFSGFFASDRLAVIQKSMAYMPLQICQKIKAESGVPFQSLSIRDILTMSPIELTATIRTRRQLYQTIRNSTRPAIIELCRHQDSSYVISILELLEASNMISTLERVLKTYPKLNEEWYITRRRVESKDIVPVSPSLLHLPLKVRELVAKALPQAGDGDKHDMYIDILTQFPWNNAPHLPIEWAHVDTTLEKRIYGHEEAKQRIRRLLVKWKRNEQSCAGKCIGLCGPPGVGKTHFARSLGDALNMPMFTVHLGGQNDAELMVGHGFTYSSARPGILVRNMAKLNTKRVIIFFDEADKTKDELINVLVHLTDPETNSQFQDRFFPGIDFDFSECLMIFSYNDQSKIDPILLDRLDQLQIQPFIPSQKIDIANRFIIPDLASTFKVDLKWITKSVLTKIIQHYTKEAGVRSLKRHIEMLAAESALRDEKGRSGKLAATTVTKLLQLSHIPKDTKPDTIHGLYATSIGIGGVCAVMVAEKKHDTQHTCATGNLGDVFKESITIADLLATNLAKKSKPYHIHIPAASTKKDGPSAGLAITMAMYAFITGYKPKKDVACTGEVDVHGNVCKIGGLVAKVVGAADAGISLVVIPLSNKAEYTQYFSQHKLALAVAFVSRVEEAIPLMIHL